MRHDVTIYVGRDALQHLLDFCQALPLQRFTIIADDNTYAAMGSRVEAMLKDAGLTVTTIVLTGDEVIADEKYLTQALIQTPVAEQTFIAVGSGTLTDITRFISSRTRNAFISVPTAASVDGFLSTGAPLVVGGVKETYRAHGPVAVFADLQTLADAPSEMSAAGFGDMVGKATSLADWKLGHLLWKEPFDPAIEERTRDALDICIQATDDIVSGSEQGMRKLIEALIESGLCMLDFGDSRPASGSEHHCSHFWELQLLRDSKPAILHGAKVGYAAILIAQLYEKVRGLSREQAAGMLEATPLPDAAAEIEEITRVYGTAADDVIRIQAPFLEMTPAAYRQLQAQVLENWQAIQEVANTVPSAAEIKAILSRAQAHVGWKSLGVEERYVYPGLLYGHNLRNRFTIVKLCRMLGVDVKSSVQL